MVTYPKDWNSLTLGDLGNIKMCRRIFSYQTEKIGQIPFYKIGTFGKKADAYISRDLYERYKSLYPYPQKGDILISAAGTIGRTVAFDGKDAYFQDSNIVWLDTSDKEVDNEFLKYFYESYPWTNLEGTTIRRLYNSLILSTFISLPSLPEQRAIAETLSCFDDHIVDLTELIEKKKAIRDGVLEDLLSGNTRLEGFSGQWKISKLKDLCSLITKQTGFDYTESIKDSLVKTKTGDVIPFIQNKDFEGRYVNYNTDYYIPQNVANSFPKILLNEKCVLISISGKLGNVGLYDGSKLAFVGGAICVVKLIDKSLADWIVCYLQSPAGQRELLKSEKASSHRNLTVEDIRNIDIPLPEENEQKSIVGILTSMDDEIVALEEEKDKMLQIKAGAMDDLLTGRIRLTRQGG